MMGIIEELFNNMTERCDIYGIRSVLDEDAKNCGLHDT